jgi:hypothetical protein
MFSISSAAVYLGVSILKLRRWDASPKYPHPLIGSMVPITFSRFLSLCIQIVGFEPFRAHIRCGSGEK